MARGLKKADLIVLTWQSLAFLRMLWERANQTRRFSSTDKRELSNSESFREQGIQTSNVQHPTSNVEGRNWFGVCRAFLPGRRLTQTPYNRSIYSSSPAA
jgi:hypothetical protein